MKTIMPKPLPATERKWYVVDARGKNLGRLATELACRLSGKNRLDYSPHVDNGDYIIVLHASEIIVTGNKAEDKVYRTHSGFMGGLKETTFNEMKVKHPTKMLELAVMGMLPKNKLRPLMLDRLKLETGDTHPYAAQKPIPLAL